MNANPLPDRVRALLDAWIDSVTQLDVLLLMHTQPARLWTAQAISAELRIGEAWTDEQLVLLTRRGLLERDAGGYRFTAAPDLLAAVEELARAYRTHPVTIVAAIYARPDRKLRHFADAFRLRKDSPADAAAPSSSSAEQQQPPLSPPLPRPPEGPERDPSHG